MNRRLVAMSGVAAALAGYAVVENTSLFQGSAPDAPAVATVAPHAPGSVKLNPLQDLDPQAYGNVLERPLFNPGRRPRPPEPEPVPQPVVEQPVEQPPPPPPPQGPGPEDYKLLGVASGPDGRVAALRSAASGEVVYVRKGATVDSWSVLDVGDRSVAVGTPENPVTFKMFETPAAATPDANAGQPPFPPPDTTLPQPAPPLPPLQPQPAPQ